MRVLAAFDFSDSATDAVRQAQAMAENGGSLALCHVLPILYNTQPFFPEHYQMNILDAARVEAELKQALENHVKLLGLNEPVELFVEKGIPYAEICRRGEDWKADRIVVGSQGKSGFARALIGSVAERVARHAHCSVYIARPAERGGVVLAATDFSDPSMPAVKAGAEEAARRGARLVAVSAVDWWGGAWTSAAGGLFGASAPLPPVETQDEVRGVMADTLREAMARFGVEGEARVIEGSPASAIVRTADELGAELVVVGTHGRTGLKRLALGSVAERVIAGAHCSVLVERLG